MVNHEYYFLQSLHEAAVLWWFRLGLRMWTFEGTSHLHHQFRAKKVVWGSLPKICYWNERKIREKSPTKLSMVSYIEIAYSKMEDSSLSSIPWWGGVGKESGILTKGDCWRYWSASPDSPSGPYLPEICSSDIWCSVLSVVVVMVVSVLAILWWSAVPVTGCRHCLAVGDGGDEVGGVGGWGAGSCCHDILLILI